MRVFLDSSALVKRYYEEPGSDQVQELMDSATHLIASALCVLEVTSALSRRRRLGQIDQRELDWTRETLFEDLSRMDVIPIADSILDEALGMIDRRSVTTLDSIQLATALRGSPDLFVCSDRSLLQAARSEGLVVLDPASRDTQA